MSALAKDGQKALTPDVLALWLAARENQLTNHIKVHLKPLPGRHLYRARGSTAMVHVTVNPSTFLRPDWHEVLESCAQSALRIRRGTTLASEERRAS